MLSEAEAREGWLAEEQVGGDWRLTCLGDRLSGSSAWLAQIQMEISNHLLAKLRNLSIT